MSRSIPTVEPAYFIAGDTVKWEILLPEYPASEGWTLKYALINAHAVISLISTTEGASHVIDIHANISKTYTPGTYYWQSFVENANASERYSINTGTMEIITSYDTDTPKDVRSKVQQIYEALEATIQGRADSAQLSRRVGDRQLQYMSAAELIKWRNFYKNEYNKELGIGGKRTTIKVRFSHD